jgi:hypothetical protein
LDFKAKCHAFVAFNECFQFRVKRRDFDSKSKIHREGYVPQYPVGSSFVWKETNARVLLVGLPLNQVLHFDIELIKIFAGRPRPFLARQVNGDSGMELETL